MEFKVVTLNVRGLRDREKRAAIFLSLALMPFNICFLQECHLRDEMDFKKFSRDWTGGFHFGVWVMYTLMDWGYW